MTDSRECWDCGGTQFELVDDDLAGLVAECTNCGGRAAPSTLYRDGDEHDREHYGIDMEVA